MGCQSSKESKNGTLAIEPIPDMSVFDVVQEPDAHTLTDYAKDSSSGNKALELLVRQGIHLMHYVAAGSIKVTTIDGKESGIDVAGMGPENRLGVMMYQRVKHTKETTVAVSVRCLEKGTGYFEILKPEPVHEGQKPSKYKSPKTHDKDLYTYAIVKHPMVGHVTNVLINGISTKGDDAVYTIHKAGNVPVKQLVKRRGTPVALIEGGTCWGDKKITSFKCTICPGIDPIFIICLCTISDQLSQGVVRTP